MKRWVWVNGMNVFVNENISCRDCSTWLVIVDGISVISVLMDLHWFFCLKRELVINLLYMPLQRDYLDDSVYFDYQYFFHRWVYFDVNIIGFVCYCFSEHGENCEIYVFLCLQSYYYTFDYPYHWKHFKYCYSWYFPYFVDFVDDIWMLVTLRL